MRQILLFPHEDKISRKRLAYSSAFQSDQMKSILSDTPCVWRFPSLRLNVKRFSATHARCAETHAMTSHVTPHAIYPDLSLEGSWKGKSRSFQRFWQQCASGGRWPAASLKDVELKK